MAQTEAPMRKLVVVFAAFLMAVLSMGFTPYDPDPGYSFTIGLGEDPVDEEPVVEEELIGESVELGCCSHDEPMDDNRSFRGYAEDFWLETPSFPMGCGNVKPGFDCLERIQRGILEVGELAEKLEPFVALKREKLLERSWLMERVTRFSHEPLELRPALSVTRVAGG